MANWMPLEEFLNTRPNTLMILYKSPQQQISLIRTRRERRPASDAVLSGTSRRRVAPGGGVPVARVCKRPVGKTRFGPGGDTV